MPKGRKKNPKMKTYQPIKRKYYDSPSQMIPKCAYFIASGQWADGHLAYSRLDENMNVVEEDECMYVQLRGTNGLFMERI